MKLLLFILIITSLCIKNNLFGEGISPKDVFPLSIGNHWLYSYQFFNSDIGNSDGSAQIDSGTVSYTVVDSASNSDTIFWSVQRNCSIIRTLQQIGALVVISETTFAVVDTSFFTMWELKRDNHPLVINEQKNFSSLWPFYTSDCDSTVIYRYQIVDSSTNTSSVKISICDNFNSRYMIYQLTFATDSGLITNTAAGTLGYHSHSGASIFSQLLTKKVTLQHSSADKSLLPAGPLLFQNFPNPFNPSTNITFSTPTKTFVTLKIFDVLGREVTTLVNEYLPAGNYSRQWNPKDASSGIYFYTLIAMQHKETKKLILLR